MIVRNRLEICAVKLGALALAMSLIACGDDSSSGVDDISVEPGESSSSSVVSGAAPDVTPGSSPSVTPDPVPGSSSSSSEEGVSSSSVTPGEVLETDPILGSSSSDAPVPEVPAEVQTSGFYSISENCPAGLNCEYVTTEYLNQAMLVADEYGEILDSRDGQVYKTIEICNEENKNCQTWMAQNLNYDSNTEEETTSWCYDYKTDNCDIYGRLYTWPAAVGKSEDECGYGYECWFSENVQGVCPIGWHLPSNEEWDVLYVNVGGIDGAGKILKASTSLWGIDTGVDKFGFSVLPAGYHYNYFDYQGRDAYFWSSTEDDGYGAKYQYFYDEFNFVRQYNMFVDGYSKVSKISIRCLKD